MVRRSSLRSPSVIAGRGLLFFFLLFDPLFFHTVQYGGYLRSHRLRIMTTRAFVSCYSLLEFIGLSLALDPHCSISLDVCSSADADIFSFYFSLTSV